MSVDISGLTKRQQEIFMLLGKNLTNKEIGDEIMMSHHTVKAELGKIYVALGMYTEGHDDLHSIRRKLMVMSMELQGEIEAEEKYYTLKEILGEATKILSRHDVSVVAELVETLQKREGVQV